MADEAIVFRTIRLPVALDDEVSLMAQQEGKCRGEIVYPMDLMRTLIEESLARRATDAERWNIFDW